MDPDAFAPELCFVDVVASQQGLTQMTTSAPRDRGEARLTPTRRPLDAYSPAKDPLRRRATTYKTTLMIESTAV